MTTDARASENAVAMAFQIPAPPPVMRDDLSCSREDGVAWGNIGVRGAGGDFREGGIGWIRH
jgi:hypothetical protein